MVETISDVFNTLTEKQKTVVYAMIGHSASEMSSPPKIEKVIFNPPATIVFWCDGTKTIVKCQNEDLFDYEKGLAMAISKKALGNKGNYCNEFKKWTKDKLPVIDLTTAEVVMHADVEKSYQILLNTLNNKKATKADLGMAIEEVIGYLGHALDA
jgi:hypothetical protein